MQWKNGRQLSQAKTSKDTITYKYNIKGLRTRKYNSDYTYYYYYDDNNNLIAMMQGGVVAYFYYDSNNSVTAMSINDAMYYYIKNLQGDITKIVNHQGKVMVEYTYDAWGNILKEKSNVSPSYATVKEFNPFRYSGYVYDTDTGLYYLQSRYYDPKTGRFINADDTAYIGATGTVLSANIFTYCENDPINNIDKTGHFFLVDDLAYLVVGALVITVAAVFLSSPAVWDALNKVVRVCEAKIKEACESLSDAIANSIDRAKTKPKSQKKKNITLLLKKLLVHLILENFYKKQT